MLFEPDDSVRLVGVSYAVCANLLGGSRFVKRIELSKTDVAIPRLAERVFHCNLFEREGEGIPVIWLLVFREMEVFTHRFKCSNYGDGYDGQRNASRQGKDDRAIGRSDSRSC